MADLSSDTYIKASMAFPNRGFPQVPYYSRS